MVGVPRRLYKTRRNVVIAFLVLAGWLIKSTFFASPQRPQWADTAVTAEQRAAVVKSVFRSAWDGYHKHAFPNDELHPLLNGYGNSRNGWGASAVEALGTAIIMDCDDIVDPILEFIPSINFKTSKTPVSLFETTIRYLGGMMSAYDLLTGPGRHLVKKQGQLDNLLKQSQILADALKFAFMTPHGVPWKVLNIDKQESDKFHSNTVGSIGTLVLEWTRLANISHHQEYDTLVQAAMQPLLRPTWNGRLKEPFPGIVGKWVNLQSARFTDNFGSWGPGADSFYEYLIKMYAYDQSRFGLNKDRWVLAADSVMKHLATTLPGTDLTLLSTSSGTILNREFTHLECFAGGNFILASKILEDKRYLNYGLKLTDSCHKLYTEMATQIGPEKIVWHPETLTDKQSAQLLEKGYAVVNSKYDLRPETMESYYYAYRATKDVKYREWAWDAFVAIYTHTKTRNGFAPLGNVDRSGWHWKFGKQESFFFSELLKYTYLIFAEEAEYQFNYDGQNNWVFNTEGHPFKCAQPW